MHRLVSPPYMQRPGIGIRIDRNRTNAYRPRGANDPASDFAAIGDKERLDHELFLRMAAFIAYDFIA